MINGDRGFGSTKILVFLTVLVLIIVGGSLFGYRSWYNSTHYVSTDNAKVVADLGQVGSINAGRILQMNVDVGTAVAEGQLIAIVDMPSVISKSDTTNTPKLGFRDGLIPSLLLRKPKPRGATQAATTSTLVADPAD